MKTQTAILFFCANALVICGGFLAVTMYPGHADYIKGIGHGLLIGTFICLFFDWKAKNKHKAAEAEKK